MSAGGSRGRDQAQARAQFAALRADGHEPDADRPVLLDNAGGSQVPRCVVDRIAHYLTNTYVQLGADYDLSRRCTATVDAARAFALRFVGGEKTGHAALGPSTSALCAALAQGFARSTAGGMPKRVIVSDAGHESNMGPWLRLAQAGWDVQLWASPPDGGPLDLDALAALLRTPTAVVAVHHVSNILGRIEPIAEICALARAHGARTVIDGVAFAPHRAIDVDELGCDFYVYSTYKVYGPHMAVLFGRHDAWTDIPGPNHFFVPESDVAYKWELGGANHEGCAGLLGTADYLAFVAGEGDGTANLASPLELPDRETVERAMTQMNAWEAPLAQRLVDGIHANPALKIVGPEHAGPGRVGTVSFVHRERSSREVAQALNRNHLTVRFGHFYAHRLVERLGLAPDDGVIRASLVHYNTEDDVDRLLRALA